jgi:tripartite-type tricarboxylate transporter receptor subunit TctC
LAAVIWRLARPVSYTLLLVTASNAINATLYDKSISISSVTSRRSPGHRPRAKCVVVNPSVPTRTVPEFIAYAKANPGRINMASAGNGTTSHLAGEMFKMMAGIDLVHVPYRGGCPALTDLLAGQVQVFFPPIVVPIGQVRAGKLRALAVTTATRSEALLDLPTVGEFVPGYEASVWFGLGVPKSTPAEIIDKLNREINAALADPRPKRGLPRQPAIRSQARLPTSASSLPMKPRSGPR